MLIFWNVHRPKEDPDGPYSPNLDGNPGQSIEGRLIGCHSHPLGRSLAVRIYRTTRHDDPQTQAGSAFTPIPAGACWSVRRDL